MGGELGIGSVSGAPFFYYKKIQEIGCCSGWAVEPGTYAVIPELPTA